MTPRQHAEAAFKDPHIMHWETELGRKILEGYLLKAGIEDARVMSVKNLVVTLKSTASGNSILQAESYLRVKLGQMFELARDASCLRECCR